MTELDDSIKDILKRFEAKDTNDQLHIIADRVSDLAVAVATQNERLKGLEASVSKMAGKVDTIEGMANKWRGAFFALAGLGGVISAVVGFWDRISKWVHP